MHGRSWTRRWAARSAALLLALLVVLAAPRPEASAAQPRIDAQAWILVDGRTGERLAAKGAARALPVASTTKLMTARLALETLELDRRLPAADYAALPVESVLGLRAGEMVSVRDLLVALLLASANDAAVTLAEGVSGSTAAFVRSMNREAARLGLEKTSYANPIGLDGPGNHSTAADLARLTRVLLDDRRFAAIVAKPEARLRSGAKTRRITTRNSLLRSDPTVTGVKTGHTLGAGYVLVASAERKGVPLISVVLGASSESARDRDTADLLDWGFDQYERRRVLRRNDRVGFVRVAGGTETVELLAGRGARVSVRAEQQPRIELETPEGIAAPLTAGERVGRAVVALDGEPLASVPAITASAVAAPGPLAGAGGPGAAVLIGGGAILILAAILAGRAKGAGAPTRNRRRTATERERSERSRSERRRDGSRRP